MEPRGVRDVRAPLRPAEPGRQDLARSHGWREIPDFAPNGGDKPAPAAMSLLDDVALRVRIELGRTRMYVEDVLRLNPDSIIELDKAAGDPVDIYVNDRYVARGEVLVLNENFCVRVSEILQPGAPFP
jgi:flagellar motor switch protein FliN/FliY